MSAFGMLASSRLEYLALFDCVHATHASASTKLYHCVAFGLILQKWNLGSCFLHAVALCCETDKRTRSACFRMATSSLAAVLADHRESLVAFLLGALFATSFHAVQRNGGVRRSLFRGVLAIARKTQRVQREIAAATEQIERSVIGKESVHETAHLQLPMHGMLHADLLQLLQRWQRIEEEHWRNGQASGAIYNGEIRHLKICTEAYACFALANPLHPELHPFVRKMESEVLAMTACMLHGNPEQHRGAMTSGGTESILMACKAYRDQANERGIRNPEIVLPTTAHAAFEKAAHYFGIRLIQVPVDQKTFKVRTDDIKSKMSSNTICVVGSAPCFPQGTIDPIEELALLARSHGCGMHVDACLGGFLLPFIEKCGYLVRPWDFRVPGVTSISADTHKYGAAVKGTSVVLFNSKELLHYMYFVAPDWTGGIYASPTIAGSRPGGLIAAAWASMIAMGEEGYKKNAKAIMNARDQIMAGIKRIDGLKVLGEPDMSVISFAVDDRSILASRLNIFKVNEALSKRHWALNTLQKPSSVHICVTLMHVGPVVKRLLEDLQWAVNEVLEKPDAFKNGSAAIYGMAEALPDNTLVTELTKTFLDALTKAVATPSTTA